MINLSEPTCLGIEKDNINRLLSDPKCVISKEYHQHCLAFFAKIFPGAALYLTPSCASALEMAALVAGFRAGDEVIMSSYTFVATANAITNVGATPVFVDLIPGCMNIDENQVEQAITEHTKAIISMPYGGISADVRKLKEIADKHSILLIEDAAHGVMTKFDGKHIGSFGHIACFSFDHIKNITCGQGGLIVINDPGLFEIAELVYEDGTDKLEFMRGKVPFFQWSVQGSNYKMTSLQAAYLAAQLDNAETIISRRVGLWNYYAEQLKPLQAAGHIKLPEVSPLSEHNAHIFFIKTGTEDERKKLISYLCDRDIDTAFHYYPLHNSRFGKLKGRFEGLDLHTTRESDTLLRLPLHHNITQADQNTVIHALTSFYAGH